MVRPCSSKYSDKTIDPSSYGVYTGYMHGYIPFCFEHISANSPINYLMPGPVSMPVTLSVRSIWFGLVRASRIISFCFKALQF